MPRSTARHAFDRAALLLFGAALFSAGTAWLHMRDLVRTYGVICGDAFGAAPHCAACYATAALLAMSGGCLALAAATLQPARARAPEFRFRRRLAGD